MVKIRFGKKIWQAIFFYCLKTYYWQKNFEPVVEKKVRIKKKFQLNSTPPQNKNKIFCRLNKNNSVLCPGQSRYPRTGPVGKNPSEPDSEPPEIWVSSRTGTGTAKGSGSVLKPEKALKGHLTPNKINKLFKCKKLVINQKKRKKKKKNVTV